jgi:hypothetical protein
MTGKMKKVWHATKKEETKRWYEYIGLHTYKISLEGLKAF